MAAVLGLGQELVEDACNQAGSIGVVGIANYNCPGQMVISGEKTAVLKAGQILKDAGGKFIPLTVSVPSHSGLMREAAEQLRNEIRRINWGSLAFPVVSNVTAREFNQEGLEEGLVRQFITRSDGSSQLNIWHPGWITLLRLDPVRHYQVW